MLFIMSDHKHWQWSLQTTKQIDLQMWHDAMGVSNSAPSRFRVIFHAVANERRLFMDS